MVSVFVSWGGFFTLGGQRNLDNREQLGLDNHKTIPLCGIFFICTSILPDGYKRCNIKSGYVEELYDADDPSPYDDSYDDTIEEIIVPAGYEYVYIGYLKKLKKLFISDDVKDLSVGAFFNCQLEVVRLGKDLRMHDDTGIYAMKRYISKDNEFLKVDNDRISNKK